MFGTPKYVEMGKPYIILYWMQLTKVNKKKLFIFFFEKIEKKLLWMKLITYIYSCTISTLNTKNAVLEWIEQWRPSDAAAENVEYNGYRIHGNSFFFLHICACEMGKLLPSSKGWWIDKRFTKWKVLCARIRKTFHTLLQ